MPKLMLLKYLLLSFSIFVVATTFAQQKELKGYLGVEHGESFTYKLSFTDSSGFINGYAYTWLDENKDVKAKITGYIDQKNKTLSFQETEIVYNHGFESNTTICLINAVLIYKDENGTRIFSGPISSSTSANVYCGQGSISFMDNETLKNLFAVPEKIVTPKIEIPSKSVSKKPMKIIYDTVSKSINHQNKVIENIPEKITDGLDKEYNWISDSLILEVWDGGKIDGDIISILLNGKIILAKYLLIKEHKRIVVPIHSNTVNQLEIIAINEGNEPPNTANLLLLDGAKQYPIIAYNTISKKAIIKIRKINN